jgi:hypothetical protein
MRAPYCLQRAAKKLCRHGLVDSATQVYLRTNAFKNDPK